MSLKNSFLMVLIFSFSTFIFFNCAGTKGDEPPDFYGDDNQQDDLDDIEALLGITSSDETSEPVETQNTRGEQLNLLEGNEVLAQEPEEEVTPAEKQALENQITQLEDQLRQKNVEISNLKADLQSKDALIDDLSSRPTSSTSSQSYASTSTSMGTSDYEMRYQEGRNAFEGKNYEAAIQYFESLLSMSTTHSLADNAQYWIGESHYALKKYDAAIIDFEKVLTFPKSNKNVDAQFKLGMCYLKKGNSAKAAEEFQRLNADYPGNRFEQRVNQILSGL
ncbi:MAG: tetratricopeptide repeat protein [Calditrichaceae bacterium]|nr:tetratricopeptide repeat protein [Calditrichaceae bacterium]